MCFSSCPRFEPPAMAQQSPLLPAAFFLMYMQTNRQSQVPFVFIVDCIRRLLVAFHPFLAPIILYAACVAVSHAGIVPCLVNLKSILYFFCTKIRPHWFKSLLAFFNVEPGCVVWKNVDGVPLASVAEIAPINGSFFKNEHFWASCFRFHHQTYIWRDPA